MLSQSKLPAVKGTNLKIHPFHCYVPVITLQLEYLLHFAKTICSKLNFKVRCIKYFNETEY